MRKDLLTMLYALCEKFDLFYGEKPNDFFAYEKKLDKMDEAEENKLPVLLLNEIESRTNLRFLVCADWFYDSRCGLEEKLGLKEKFKIKTSISTETKLKLSLGDKEVCATANSKKPGRIPVSIVVGSINVYLKSVNWPKRVLEVYDTGAEDFAVYVVMEEARLEEFKTEFSELISISKKSIPFSTGTQKKIATNLVIEK